MCRVGVFIKVYVFFDVYVWGYIVCYIFERKFIKLRGWRDFVVFFKVYNNEDKG